MLIGTAKLNAIDPQAYPPAVRAPFADHPINRIEEPLPWEHRSPNHKNPRTPESEHCHA
jgi:hypothetical protein